MTAVNEATSAAVMKLVNEITEKFIGQDDDAVGYALALLTACFVARHVANDAEMTKQYRRETYKHQFETVAQMMPFAIKIVEKASGVGETKQ